MLTATTERLSAVEAGTNPPYQFGDHVDVLLHNLHGWGCWVPGVILECDLPKYARRFVCKVAVGHSINAPVVMERVYCWENGHGEEITPH